MVQIKRADIVQHRDGWEGEVTNVGTSGRVVFVGRWISVADLTFRYNADAEGAPQNYGRQVAPSDPHEPSSMRDPDLKEAALEVAIALAEEGWNYAPDYFQKKWNPASKLSKLRAIAGVTDNEPLPSSWAENIVANRSDQKPDWLARTRSSRDQVGHRAWDRATEVLDASSGSMPQPWRNAAITLIAEHENQSDKLREVAAAAAPFLAWWGKHSGLCCTFDETEKVIVTPESCRCDEMTKRLRVALDSLSLTKIDP